MLAPNIWNVIPPAFQSLGELAELNGPVSPIWAPEQLAFLEFVICPCEKSEWVELFCSVSPESALYGSPSTSPVSPRSVCMMCTYPPTRKGSEPVYSGNPPPLRTEQTGCNREVS